jgi:hypothetical protein
MRHSCLSHRPFIISAVFLISWPSPWSRVACLIVLNSSWLQRVCCSQSPQRRTNLQYISDSFRRISMSWFLSIRMLIPCRSLHVRHSEPCSTVSRTWVRTWSVEGRIRSGWRWFTSWNRGVIAIAFIARHRELTWPIDLGFHHMVRTDSLPWWLMTLVIWLI